jgi:DnaJ-class molecular chaperone
MKKIIDSRRLLSATAKSDLAELSKLYKTLMKVHHPDRFTDEKERHEAEATSKHLIEAYHFLVSISPETHAKNTEEYEKTITTSPIKDWHYKAQTLHVTFNDGSIYEYFSVPSNVYNKFIKADGNARFARRHIFSVFTYRRIGGPVEA